LPPASGKISSFATLGMKLQHPLTPITQAIHLLRKAHQDPGTTELLETIDTQSQTLLRFVDDLANKSPGSTCLSVFSECVLKNISRAAQRVRWWPGVS
jgi:hypothetical protein